MALMTICALIIMFGFFIAVIVTSATFLYAMFYLAKFGIVLLVLWVIWKVFFG